MINNQYKIKYMEKNLPGKLIVFDGQKASGKSTALRAIAETLTLKNKNVLSTYVPTNLTRQSEMFNNFVTLGNKNDVDFEAFQLLHICDRLQHNRKIISESLQNDFIVLCDRYLYSTLATILSFHKSKFEWFDTFAKKILKPDITFIFTCETDEIRKRLQHRTTNNAFNIDEMDNNNEIYVNIAKENELYHLDTTHIGVTEVYNFVLERIIQNNE